MSKNCCGKCMFVYERDYCLLYQTYIADDIADSCHDYITDEHKDGFTEEEWEEYCNNERAEIESCKS